MADDALELSFDPASDDAVVDVWDRLRFASIPSQADHARGMTNAPHLSVAVAAHIPQVARDAARECIVPLLPARLSVRGVVVLGSRSRVSIAWLAEPDAELSTAVAQVRAAVPALRHPVWLPHITLARRVPRERVGEAMAEVGSVPGELIADRLRWWDAAAGTIDVVQHAAN